MSAFKSASLSTFPFSTKFVKCKYRDVHTPKPKLEISENERLSSGINIPNIRYANEDKREFIQSRKTQIDKSFQVS